jgi:CMP/dCMP kinase
MKITIARQCGSGGHRVAELLSKKLEMEVFDKKRFIEEAKLRKVYEENRNFLSEKPIDSFLYSIAMSYGVKNPRSRYIDFVKELTEEKDCIIIGRCANYIYRENPDCISIYLHADKDIRSRHLQERDQISEKEALNHIQMVDDKRAAFHEQCTSTKWGQGDEYDLCIDTGKIGLDRVVEIILHYMEARGVKKEVAE